MNSVRVTPLGLRCVVKLCVTTISGEDVHYRRGRMDDSAKRGGWLIRNFIL